MHKLLSGSWRGVSALALTTMLLAAPARAAPLPDAIDKLLEAAGGDEAQLKTVADLAKKTNPESVAEVDAKVAAIQKANAEAREAKLAAQGFFDGWSGAGDVGAFFTSGNTDNTGVAVGLSVAKESRHWKHALRGLVDYQENNGVKTKERYFVGYEGNYKISPRLYALATLSWERDTFSGFDRRFAESLGIGYNIFDSERLKWNVEGGPALRQTLFTDGRDVNKFAARIGTSFAWEFLTGIILSEDATLFYDDENTSFMSLTALTAKLTSKLAARASFQLNTESNPPAGRRNEDTTTRFSLVYSF